MKSKVSDSMFQRSYHLLSFGIILKENIHNYLKILKTLKQNKTKINTPPFSNYVSPWVYIFFIYFSQKHTQQQINAEVENPAVFCIRSDMKEIFRKCKTIPFSLSSFLLEDTLIFIKIYYLNMCFIKLKLINMLKICFNF